MRAYGNGEEGHQQRGQPGSGGAAPHKHTHTRRHIRADKTQTGLLHSRPFNRLSCIHGAFSAFIRRDGCVDLQVSVPSMSMSMSMSMSVSMGRWQWTEHGRRRAKTTALGKNGAVLSSAAQQTRRNTTRETRPTHNKGARGRSQRRPKHKAVGRSRRCISKCTKCLKHLANPRVSKRPSHQGRSMCSLALRRMSACRRTVNVSSEVAHGACCLSAPVDLQRAGKGWSMICETRAAIYLFWGFIS